MSKNRKACLIFNPISGQGDPDADLEQIKAILSPEIELDIQLTSKEVQADTLARQAIERGAQAIIASGGDGTLWAVAKVVTETETPLAIIPRGTANAFAAALGIPDNIPAACQVILNGTTKKVDAARCNGQSMVLLAGIGFEAEVIDETSRQAKNRWGVLAYILSGLQELPQMQRFEIDIETEDKTIHAANVAAVTIANAAPPTSIWAQGPAEILYDDGMLDVTIVAIEKWTEALATSFHLLRAGQQGEAAQRDNIGYLRTKRLKITTNPPQKVVLDGEPIGTTPVEIECIHKGLTIFVPEATSEKPTEKLNGLPQLEVQPKI